MLENKLKYLLLVPLLLLGLYGRAQVVVEQTVDSVGILIGQQAHLRLSVTLPKGAHLQWPQLQSAQYVVPGLEVVETHPADTVSTEGSQLKVDKVYTITSFDEKLYSIPGLPVKVNGKTYRGGTAALKVITVDVDTLHPNQFYPPKDVQDNPFLWSEWSPYLWLALLVLLLAVVAYYIVVCLHQNRPVIATIRVVRHVPAHQKALGEIEKIKAGHMQTSEDQKSYYTQLTDTLRKYIQERFGFSAMEMTSAEIIEQLRQSGDQQMLDELKGLFATADLVKFAKYSTMINENDLNLVNAIHFIDVTKQEGQAVEERIVPTLSDSDRRKQESRYVMKGSLWVLGLVIAGLLAYIFYNVYLLTV